jgi:hypothetical protein
MVLTAMLTGKIEGQQQRQRQHGNTSHREAVHH